MVSKSKVLPSHCRTWASPVSILFQLKFPGREPRRWCFAQEIGRAQVLVSYRSAVVEEQGAIYVAVVTRLCVIHRVPFAALDARRIKQGAVQVAFRVFQGGFIFRAQILAVIAQ